VSRAKEPAAAPIASIAASAPSASSVAARTSPPDVAPKEPPAVGPPAGAIAAAPPLPVDPPVARARPSVVAKSGGIIDATEPRDVAPLEPAVAEAPPVSASELARETSSLYAVSATLRGGDAAQALRALDDFARAFPDGALAPEAAALKIDALMQLGDPASRATAGRLALAFLRDHPRSPLAARVRALVGASP